jgi:hypothetical protein
VRYAVVYMIKPYLNDGVGGKDLGLPNSAL